MPLVYYVTHTGDQYEASVVSGDTVMQGAVDNMIDGILAQCGGSCSCATCHCYVDPQWMNQVGSAGAHERDTLEAVCDLKENSRLSCQIVVTDNMEGLVIHLPASQY